MNDFGSLAEGLRYYEQLRAIIEMSFYKSQAQGSICYKQLKVVDHMNLSGS